jgi:hypothetical protein
MSAPPDDRLYNLLPAIYRIRDVAEGEPLRGLLRVIEREAVKIESDIAGLYDNWFIETCDEWVVAYIGDLLGIRRLQPLGAATATERAYVANTLSYRRRKGTAAVLEQLARDVTGWPARVVEFFELLGTTQHLNHLRPQNLRTPDLRDINRLGLLDTPFDTIAHTGEVRHIASGRGKYNIPNIGLFLWRLQSYLIIDGTASPVTDPPDARYHLNPLGNDAPLFTRPGTETALNQLADETNVPAPIRVAAFYFDLQDYQNRYASVSAGDRPASSVYYGPNGSLTIIVDGDPRMPLDVVCMDLSKWDRPPAGKVGVDVRSGRLALPAGAVPSMVQVTYNYGFSADIGGGPYDRRQQRSQGAQDASAGPDTVATPTALGTLITVPSPGIDTLAEALVAWVAAASPPAVIQIGDNRSYREDLTIPMAGADLVIQAANNGRPVLLGDITVTGGSGTERLTLNGLLVAGRLELQSNLTAATVTHCTLVPGRRLYESGASQEPEEPSVIVASTNDNLALTLDHCISGPLRVPTAMASLTIRDSIVDSPVRGRRARSLPALVSGTLAPFPALGPNTPKVLNITIGDDGPYLATLAGVPATLAEACDQLQAAIQAAHSDPAFSQARVIVVDNRSLVILPGTPGTVLVESAGSDTTASDLRLTPDAARQVYTLVGGALEGFSGLRASNPRLRITMGDSAPRVAALNPAPSSPQTPAQAREQLQAAIQAANGSPAFTAALVGLLDDHLVVLPGDNLTEVLVTATPDDPTTILDLALESDRPAIAASAGGQQPGPPTTMERVTILGAIHVKELDEASDVIFAGPARTERRQVGCVRFSYVEPGSRMPRRYRCQPDLEIATRTAAATERAAANNSTLSAADAAAIEAGVHAWLVPSFTSSLYGAAAYGQLSRTCPMQISTGAEDGSEMGVYSSLKQPQREANLRTALDEYLRLGLEAGIFYVT